MRSVTPVTRRSNATGGTSFAVQQLNTLQLSAYAYTETKTAGFASVDIRSRWKQTEVSFIGRSVLLA
jgi:hypothetical protein